MRNAKRWNRLTGTALTALVLLSSSVGRAQSLDKREAPTPAQIARLHQALEPLHAKYDPSERMLKQPLSSPGYHTALKGGSVHSTRASLDYAVALLDTRDEALRARAEAILDRVIGLQDQDPASKTYGIWSWFLEEPLEKMSPPDWNWADFCGTALLQVALDHRDRISKPLLAKVDAAVRHAANSIRKRNVGPGYTNIAIMGTYVTLVAAEVYDIPDLKEYALARWRRFYQFTTDNGAFAEYNSPTYTLVALKELGRMLRDVKEPDARRMTEEIYKLAWREIAQHFHPPTRQWAGPHSRCYQTLLGADVLALIQRSTAGRVDFGVDRPSLDEYRVQLPCPLELEPLFLSLTEAREIKETFLKGNSPIIGTTHLEPAFALGSVNRADLWNQRRPLLAYWGWAAQPAYLRLRFLHDDYDFTAAQFYSVQKGGTVLAGINLDPNGGDTHPSLDKIKNGTIRAKDLRLRFEFGGAAAKSKIAKPLEPGAPVLQRFGNLRVYLAIPYARWDSEGGKWETGSDAASAWLDLVFYKGQEREFRLAELEQAVVAMALQLGTEDQAAANAKAEVQSGILRLNWQNLALQLPVKGGRKTP